MNIYFSGSMTHSQEKIDDYKILIEYLENYGTVLNKFVGEKIINKNPIDIYNRDVENLKRADILVADVTVVSTGVGFELGYADNLKIKTLIIYDENKPLPSGLIIGNPNFLVKSYNTLEDAKNVIDKFINDLK